MTDRAESEPLTGSLENLVSLEDQQIRLVNRTGRQSGPLAYKAMHEPPARVFHSNNSSRSTPGQVTFNRQELNEILRIYGFRVAAGEWRDYAIDHLKDRAVFSIFRKNGEIALFRIEKNPKLVGKQGVFSVITVAGTIIKRGSDLRQVLRVFDKKPKLKIL